MLLDPRAELKSGAVYGIRAKVSPVLAMPRIRKFKRLRNDLRAPFSLDIVESSLPGDPERQGNRQIGE